MLRMTNVLDKRMPTMPSEYKMSTFQGKLKNPFKQAKDKERPGDTVAPSLPIFVAKSIFSQVTQAIVA